MGILAKLIWIFLNFICVAIELTMFWVIVKMILNRWMVNWLIPFDVAGKRLVDSYTNLVEKCWRKVSPTVLTSQGRLAVGLAILIISRFLIMVIAGIL
ncbi:MAG: hypothetical protein ABSB11_07610 [Sedimentisphaerales bacterium]